MRTARFREGRLSAFPGSERRLLRRRLCRKHAISSATLSWKAKDGALDPLPKLSTGRQGCPRALACLLSDLCLDDILPDPEIHVDSFKVRTLQRALAQI